MKIRVVYTAQLRSAMGRDFEQIEVGDSCTLEHLVQQLANRHGAKFSELVFGQRGQLLPSIVLCVGDQQVTSGSQTRLRDGDEVTILSAISGG